MLPSQAIAGIGHELNAVDPGEPHTIGDQWQPCAAGAYSRTCGPDAGIQICEELDCDGIGSGTDKIRGTQAIERKSTERIRRACSRAHTRGDENGAGIVVWCPHHRPISGSGRGDDIRGA